MKSFALIIAIILLNVNASCKKSGSHEGNNAVPASDTSLQKMMPFKFGASVNINLLQNNPAYTNVVIHEYSSLTAENVMKFKALHPAENSYTWADADYLVNFAQVNGAKRIHGHTLIWHSALPDWIANYTGDSATLENIMKTHIQTVVSHFKGKVSSWDVVNEAFMDDGTLRKSIWQQKLGDDYIARAFQYAHEADPDALLFYNDYGQEYSPVKRRAIVNMVADFRQRGIRIDGLGLQFHITLTQSDAAINDAISAAAATGLKVHLSELDIRLNNAKVAGLAFTSEMAQQQATKYNTVVKTYHTVVPVAQQFGITTWNVGDADSWIPSFLGGFPDWPLPFDKYYHRKLAYYAIISAVK
ncbi:endo-1,4-beta-xylanase [Chitinophaga vietnamensis]|uniref:endo-1,4-beta-xylanase n=1 Tax=Chitinophaga vietnamensis TaxID=2593957 RepID=UPI0011780849|nr:endo-1,4-beta-xylanase [Chitinophaga vietnamensis]